MKSSRAVCLFDIVLSLGLFSFLVTARADTDAVSVLVQDGAGYSTGAVGFSFTPTTNLLVTQVGYLEFANTSNPIVRIWSGTNFPIASFSLTPGPGFGQMNYTNVSLVLLAGQPYALTVQDGPLSAGRPCSFQSSYPNTHFQVASQLSNYASANLDSSGSWSSLSSDVLLFGPNLSFQIQTSPIVGPTLAIAAGNGSNVIVSWPAASAGYVLQQNPVLPASAWTLTTNPVSVVGGTNRVILPALTSNLFFRLFHP